MGKYSDVDIDAMLKRIQDNVDKQSAEKDVEVENKGPVSSNTAESTPDDLINLIMADIGKNGGTPKKSTNMDEYDIRGFEIEDSLEEEDEEIELVDAREKSVEDSVEMEETEKLNLDEDSETVEEDESDESVELTENGESVDCDTDLCADEVIERSELIAEESENEDETEDSYVEHIVPAADEESDNLVLEQLDYLEKEEQKRSVIIGCDDEKAEPIYDTVVESDDSDVVTPADTVDIFDELSVKNDSECVEEDEFDGNFTEADEEVRLRVEQFVSDTVAPQEEFIFFDSLDKYSKKTSESDEIEEDTIDYQNLAVVTSAFEGKDYSQVNTDHVKPHEGTFVNERGDLDDSDINLSISLGSKDSLETEYGFVKVREAKHNFVNPENKGFGGNSILNHKNKEYKSFDQNDEIKDCYRKEKKNIALRLAFSLSVFLLTVFCEIVYSVEAVTVPVISEIFSVPLFYNIFSAFLLSIAVAISAKKLYGGVIGFFTVHSNYYTTTGVVALVNILYNLFVVFAPQGKGMPLFNSVAVFGLMLVIVGEYMQIVREINTFSLVSDGKPKISLERVERSIDNVKKESFLHSNDFVIESSNFVGRYFERSAKTPETYHTRHTFMTLSMLLSVFVAVVATLVTKRFTDSIVAFELCALICVPVQFVMLGAYPFYIVSKKLLKLDSAIIGETIVDEYVGPNNIYLDDVEVFGKHGVHVVNLDPFNGFNIIDVNYYYLSVFSNVEGPLKNAFGDIPESMKISENVVLENVFPDGIEALVDDKYRVLVGKAEFLKSKGIRFAKIVEGKYSEKGDISVMYMAVNGALCAKMQLKYTITHHFEKFAEDMAINKAHVGVRTIDPNVTEEMVSRLPGDLTSKTRVMRPTLNDLVPIGRRSDSGIITEKNTHMVARVLAEGVKLKKINNVTNILWAIYSVLGIIAMGVFVILGLFEYILPIYIIGYEVVWMLGLIFYIKNKLKNRKLR